MFAGLSAKGSLSTTVYAVPLTTWAEKTITWNNRPARSTVLAAFTLASKTSALIDIDLTSYLLSERAQGRNVVSLALHSVANTALTLKANSREAKTNKPLLVFTTDKAPTVSLTAPLANGVFPAWSTIDVAASVSDPDGSITQVEFFQGSTLIGTATRAPYAIHWSNVAAGSYGLTAKATDNSGVATTSAAAVHQLPGRRRGRHFPRRERQPRIAHRLQWQSKQLRVRPLLCPDRRRANHGSWRLEQCCSWSS